MLTTTTSARERALAFVVLAAVVLFRSGVFVAWPQTHFDADSAITGLMGLHISQGRAFPVFYYGQSYMLAVESYLAAPLFLLAGPSVTALKLPLLAINLAIAFLLFRVCHRDIGLRPLAALAPVMFFALPAPGTTARILEANGGNVAPFLYVLLIWITRHRPVWCGVAFGLGFLHREFTVYGLLALIALDLLRRDLFTRLLLLRRFTTLATAGAIWLAAGWVNRFSSAAGPETTPADVYNPQSNLFELLGRVCLDPRATLEGVPRLTTEHWPVLFGTQPLALRDFGIESAVWQGTNWSWLLLLAVLLAPAVWLAVRARAVRAVPRHHDAAIFLMLAAVFSLLGYVVGRCGTVGFYYMRYDMLAIFGAAGLAAAFLRTRPPAILQAAWIGALVLWLSVAAVGHARLYAEYLGDTPLGGKQFMIRELDARGIRYVLSDYWTAYAITFLTGERIIAASDDFIRIPLYGRIVGEHLEEAVRISREPCAAGEEVAPRLWFCRPE